MWSLCVAAGSGCVRPLLGGGREGVRSSHSRWPLGLSVSVRLRVRQRVRTWIILERALSQSQSQTPRAGGAHRAPARSEVVSRK